MVTPISKAILRVAVSVFLIFLGYAVVLTAKRPVVPPQIIVPKTYDENERKIVQKMDSISKLPVDKQRELFNELTEEYRSRYLD